MSFQKFPIPSTAAFGCGGDSAQKAKSLAICSSPEARSQLDYELAASLCVLPLGYTGTGSERLLQLAVPECSDHNLQSQLRFAVNSKIKCIEIEESLLRKAIEISYKADDALLEQSLGELKQQSVPEIKSIQVDFIEEYSTNPVPRALKTLLEYAVAKGASDLHFLPTPAGLMVKLRVNGELLSHHQPICSSETGSRLISRLKVLASLRIDERALPQDGALSLGLKNGTRQLRVSTLPTIHGEKCVLRISSNSSAQTLENLGFSQDSLNAILSTIGAGSGLLLLTGSTGSGKTTTLYSITQELIKQNLGISSVEDPVEAHIEGASQTCLAPEKGLDYPNALRSILRQDPDVILVGEIRDIESARLVISAALTGHLVLSTVHGSSVRESVSRLLQMGIDTGTLNQVLRLIINQSLVRRLCSKCKVLDLLSSQQHEIKIFRNVGCASCDYSGFDGRLLVTERMLFGAEAELGQFMSQPPGQLGKLPGYEAASGYLKRYLEAGLILPGDK